MPSTSRQPHDVLRRLGEEFHGPWAFVLHGLASPILGLAAAGVLLAWYLYLKRPELAGQLRERAGWLYTLLENKYYFDEFNESFIAGGSRALGNLLWRVGDVAIIDGAAVNGSARVVGWLAVGDARHAVRLPVPLCLRDDHRPLGAARVAPLGEADPCKLTGPS